MKKEMLSRGGSAVLLLTAGAFLAGCGQEPPDAGNPLEQAPVVAVWQTNGTDSLLAGDASLLKDTLTLPLSRWLDDFRMIRLDNRDEALVGEGAVFLSENYIGFRGSGTPFKLFDRDGRYLNDIGKVGQGPNEYNTVYYAQIDEANDRVYLIPWANTRQIFVYDLKGNYYPPIPLAYNAPKMNFRVDLPARTVTVGAMPFEGGNCPAVWMQDLEGNVIREIPGAPYAVYPDFSNEVTMDFGPADPRYYILRWDAKADSLYAYRAAENRLSPRFTMRFAGDKIPMHNYLETDAYFLGSVTGGVVMTEPNIWKPLPPANYLVDKQSGKGSYIRIVNDLLDNETVTSPIYSIRNGYWIMNYDPGDLLDILEVRLADPGGLTDEQADKLRRLQESVTVDDNNILFIGTLKKGRSLEFAKGETYTPLSIDYTSREKRKPRPAPQPSVSSSGGGSGRQAPPPPPPPPPSRRR